MFIEQTIEFQWRDPGLLGRTCNSKTGYFDDKQRSPRQIFELIITYC